MGLALVKEKFMVACTFASRWQTGGLVAQCYDYKLKEGFRYILSPHFETNRVEKGLVSC